MLHLIKETSHLPTQQEAMHVYGSFDSQFVHLIRNINRCKNVQAEKRHDISEYSFFYMWTTTRNAFLKHVQFAILAGKGISIVARMCWQKQTWYMCIFFVLNMQEHQKWYMCIFFLLNVEEHQKCFLKTQAVRNSCSKGNIDCSKNVLTKTWYMCIFFVLKCGRTPERPS